MTILRDGEKFACKQCIQGHRVSTCRHEERPLIHVARKGRPVSQCPHCRGLRKQRSTHARCECGERGHSRTASAESNSIAESEDCQCGHGKRCVCALKKDKPAVPYRRSESAVPTSRVPVQSRASSSHDGHLQLPGHCGSGSHSSPLVQQPFGVTLDQDVLARTLSPQNPKRYSMNDWSMMTFGGQGFDKRPMDAWSQGDAASADYPAYLDGWAESSVAASSPAHTSTTYTEWQPELSASSTGTLSDAGDLWSADFSAFLGQQPTITIDASATGAPVFDDGAFSFTPASYADPAEFRFPGQADAGSLDMAAFGKDLSPEYAFHESIDPLDAGPASHGSHGSHAHALPLSPAQQLHLQQQQQQQQHLSAQLDQTLSLPQHTPHLRFPDAHDWAADDEHYLSLMNQY